MLKIFGQGGRQKNLWGWMDSNFLGWGKDAVIGVIPQLYQYWTAPPLLDPQFCSYLHQLVLKRDPDAQSSQLSGQTPWKEQQQHVAYQILWPIMGNGGSE